MTSYAWKGLSGNWKTASHWTPAGGPPKSTDTARIKGAATTTITVDTADVANSLTLSDANATLNDDGPNASLTIGGTLTMSNGALYISPGGDGGSLTVGALNLSGGALIINSGGQLKLNGTLSLTGGRLTLSGGTISGGTIDSTAGTLTYTSSGGTLSGVTFEGPLNLTAYDVSVDLASGTRLVGSSGSGPGTINDTGFDSYLYVDNTQTLNSVTINLGNSIYNSSFFAYLYEHDTAGAGDQVLTLASSVTIDVAGNAELTDSGYSGDGIINKGAIDVFAGSANYLVIDSNVFTNKGTIDLASGDTAIIEPTTFTTTAASVITIAGNSSLTIDPTNTWTNLGSITLAPGASLYLDGSTSTKGLGSLSNSDGTVYIAGTWNNSGQTLNGSASFGELALYGGTISGGTVTSAGVSFTSQGGTLSGVTFDGPLNLTADSRVALASGTTVVGWSGLGPGTINDTGSGASLSFDNTQTVSNVTINLGNTSGNYSYLDGASDQVLTLAPSVTVDVAGYAYINSSDGIVNRGVIDQTGSDGYLVIDPNAFTNSGTIDAAATGFSLVIEPNAFTNSGTIDVANGDSVIIQPTTFTTTASSMMTIEANSSLEIKPTNAWANLGSITLASGASLTSSFITNDGLLERTGGTGTGVVTSEVTNAGTIEVSSGTLALNGAVTGAGKDTISGAATLEFGAGVSTATTLGDQNIGFTGRGTLDLLNPTSFYGEISDFGTGDTVELLGSWAFSSISQAGGVTTLTLASGSTKHGFEFVGSYAESNFSIVSGTTTTVKYA